MSKTKPQCKNTRYAHENHYGDKYHGYCLDCMNAGVPELHSAIEEARKLLKETAAKLDPDGNEEAWFLTRIAKIQEALEDHA